MTAYSTLKAKLAGFFHDLPDPATTDTPVAALSGSHLGPQVAERMFLRKVYNVTVSADADAGTDRTDALFNIGVPASEYPNGAEVISIKLRSKAITTHASTHFTDTFSAVGSDGVADSTVGTITSDSDVTVANGGLNGTPAATTANKPYTAFLSATVADRRVVPNGSLSLTLRDKASTGVQLGEVFYEVVLEAL